jgi:chemotaxis-related protein WspD
VLRIAIVNDLRMAAEILRRVVSSEPGYEISWIATDGAEAVARCEQDPPDLILMDLIMPVMDGVEATRRIMMQTPCAVLIVTATVSGNAGKVFEAMGYGALDAVSTPVMGPGNEIGISGDGTCPKLKDDVHCRNCPVYSDIGRSLLDRPPPDDYQDQWVELLGQAKKTESLDTVSVLVFSVGREWLALKTGIFKEIVPSRAIHTIPHRSSAVLLGIVNIRGELLLCASLSQVLRVEEAERRNEETSGANFRRMIVIGREGERWVFPVDEVDRIYRIHTGELENVPVTIAGDASAYSRGIFALDGKRVALLDEELLFNALRRSLRWQATV